MLALLMTYSDDWTFRRDHLMKVGNIGRDRFQKIMNELSGRGYVRLEAQRGEGGRVAGTTWIILDEPDSAEDLKTRPSVTEGLNNRTPVEPESGESGPIRKNNSEENQSQEKCSEEFVQSTGQQAASDNVRPSEKSNGTSSEHPAFAEFWNVHPRVRCRARTAKLFGDAVNSGADPKHVVASARQYAAESYLPT